jgi:hypothetical protein
MVIRQRIHHPEENHTVPIIEAGGAARLYLGQPTTTSAQLFQNTQTQLKAVIREIVLANNSTATGTISLQAGPNNSAVTGIIIPTAYQLAAASTTAISLNVVLNPNDTIWGIQSVATGITVCISGEYVN